MSLEAPDSTKIASPPAPAQPESHKLCVPQFPEVPAGVTIVPFKEFTERVTSATSSSCPRRTSGAAPQPGVVQYDAVTAARDLAISPMSWCWTWTRQTPAFECVLEENVVTTQDAILPLVAPISLHPCPVSRRIARHHRHLLIPASSRLTPPMRGSRTPPLPPALRPAPCAPQPPRPPLAHTPGIVVWSVRRVESIVFIGIRNRAQAARLTTKQARAWDAPAPHAPRPPSPSLTHTPGMLERCVRRFMSIVSRPGCPYQQPPLLTLLGPITLPFAHKGPALLEGFVRRIMSIVRPHPPSRPMRASVLGPRPPSLSLTRTHSIFERCTGHAPRCSSSSTRHLLTHAYGIGEWSLRRMIIVPPAFAARTQTAHAGVKHLKLLAAACAAKHDTRLSVLVHDDEVLEVLFPRFRAAPLALLLEAHTLRSGAARRDDRAQPLETIDATGREPAPAFDPALTTSTTETAGSRDNIDTIDASSSRRSAASSRATSSVARASLLELIDPTALPLTHTLGIIARSERHAPRHVRAKPPVSATRRRVPRMQFALIGPTALTHTHTRRIRASAARMSSYGGAYPGCGGPIAVPLTHTPNFVQWSVRRVKSIVPPVCASAPKPPAREPRSLIAALPLTHTPGIIEWVVRRVTSIVPSVPATTRACASDAAAAVECALETRLAAPSARLRRALEATRGAGGLESHDMLEDDIPLLAD
ncbi:hypothetical protein DFH06DRAFT_1314144 [Mycena polygramma]|nr:hypothetical protein DFH06DRAFT_1314144 [Mycena polygramma]